MTSLLITVLIFLRTDCPVSNSYAPEIERLSKAYASRGVQFQLVFPDRALSQQQIDRYRREYALTIPAKRDPDRAITTKAQAITTPEAAVFVGGRLVYHGRIDNRYAAIGKARPAATEHDLEQVLQAVTQGHESPFAHRPAIGCAIGDLP
ncbi:MAG: redoxin domain-containing protein [Acidobacteriota bacterium]|nr:redoxin domain-containing protein [Acidobacteriota bacterium]